ncbi:MAG: Do family serine endopeptidase [Pseudomonadota bacterium]
MHNRIFICFLVLMLMTAPVLAAETAQRQVPQSDSQVKLSYAPLVKKTAPAVVNIYTKRVVRQRARVSPFFGNPFFDDFFGRGFGGLERERVANALGSGVILDQEGLIVTNAHVIKDASEINVVLKDGREFEAEKVFFDERFDLAVLRIDGGEEPLPVLKLAPHNDLEVGDLVLAIGNPFGVGQTVTSGIVSALARTAVGIGDQSFFIQTDAAINPGNSGGALVSMDGYLVGVNSAIFSHDGGSLGIGFAIPAELVRTVLNSVRAGQDKLVKPWIGAKGQSVTSDIAKALGLPSAQGAMVNRIHPQSPAAKAGLKKGDVILEINGQQINDPAALKFYLAMVEIGAPVELEVHRKDGVRHIRFTAEHPPETPPRNETLLEGRHPLSGAVVANINPALEDELNMVIDDQGVVVIDFQNRNRLGLQVGDIVYSLNGSRVKSVDQLQALLDKSASGWAMKFKRDGRILSLIMR